jgi:PKD repeat protein/Flp pilus assembly protein TadG
MIRFRSTRPDGTGRATHARHRREGSRGQSLVEFALVLPIVLFLTLTALDFGRVYLGYINLQNMARIAANFAANNPSAWDATPNADVQQQYKNQILADAAATNCTLPLDGSGNAVVPTPTFTDMNGNGLTTDLGDTAQVQIACAFHVITPGVANVVGGSVRVAAASSFPVKSGMTATGPGGGGGSPPNAAFSGNGVIASVGAPATISGTVPFTVDFRDTSGGNPTQWLWTFSDTTPATESHVQDPLLHTFQAAGTYTVTMQATNLFGSSTASMTVNVTPASAVAFHANKQDIPVGDTVSFYDDSTTGGTAWAWAFGAGQGTGTGQTPTHTYTATGTYTVSLTVTYPSPTGPLSHTEVGYIRVNVGMCSVPQLGGVRFNDAQARWQGAPYNFTGVVVRAPGAPSGNFIITAQSITYGVLAKAPCDSDVVVDRP